MNFSYYAAKEDRICILNFILGEKCWQIYDSNLYSEFENVLPRPYLRLEDLEAKIASEVRSARFVLYSSEFGGAMLFTKTAHKRRDGTVEFRLAPEGWGVIQLEFGTIWNDLLQPSLVSHNSEQRARGWASTIQEFGDPELWNWKEVERCSRKIGSFIKKQSVVKFHDGSYVSHVMPHANEILKKSNSLP